MIFFLFIKVLFPTCNKFTPPESADWFEFCLTTILPGNISNDLYQPVCVFCVFWYGFVWLLRNFSKRRAFCIRSFYQRSLHLRNCRPRDIQTCPVQAIFVCVFLYVYIYTYISIQSSYMLVYLKRRLQHLHINPSVCCASLCCENPGIPSKS